MLKPSIHLIALLTCALPLSKTLSDPPPNDNFANAQALTINVPVNGTTLDATSEPGDPISGDRTVWYSWTAPVSSLASISAVATMNPVNGYLVYGTPLLATTFLDRSVVSGTPLYFYAVAGQTYRLCIDDYVPGYINYAGIPFTVGLSVSKNLPADVQFVPPLSNDDFANALQFNQKTASYVLYVAGATFEPFELALARTIASVSSSSNGGVWMAWTAPVTGSATFTAQTPSGNTPVLFAATGGSIASMNIVASSDQGGLLFNCKQGTVYNLYVLSQNDNDVLVELSSVGTSTGGGVIAQQAGLFAGQLGSGFFSIALSATGSFTGKAIANGVTYPLSGIFDSTGNYAGTATAAGKPSLAFSLHLDLTNVSKVPASYVVTGSFGGVPISARHAAYAAGTAAAEAGVYTVLLPPADASTSVPRGSGYATLTVTKTGVATMVGKLADNTPFSASGTMVGGSDGNRLLVFVPTLYSNRGLLTGAVTFEKFTTSNCDGILDWRKPASPGVAYYGAGFDTGLVLTGAHYTPPAAGHAALPVGKGTLTLDGGNLSVPIDQSLTLLFNDTFALTGADTEQLQIAINPATGVFSGSFVHPLTPTQRTPFSGVLYQNANAPQAAGFFLGPLVGGKALSGNVSLTP